MSDLLWSFDQLSRYTRYEDPEVRYWAAERLIALFPAEAPEAIADLILDEHDATPEMVADHLGSHGDPRHIPVLLKGFRRGYGTLAGRCLDALARLKFEGTAGLAQTVLHQRDVPEGTLAMMVAALVRLDGGEDRADAVDQARDFLLRRPELFAEPEALRAAAAIWPPCDFSDLIRKWLTAMHFTGREPMDLCVRVLLESMQLEDIGWCIRTDRAGRIDLGRTLKAVESGHDLDLTEAIPRGVRDELDTAFTRGSFPEMAGILGSWVRSRVARLARRDGDPLPDRLDALGAAFMDPACTSIADPMEPAMHQWLIGLLISAAIKVSCYRNYLIDLDRAGRDLEALLALAESETSSLIDPMPPRIAEAAQGEAKRERAAEWCLRTLEARGPFFPKAVALETLGRLGRDDLIPEIVPHLADDSSYIYGAAERALVRIGDPVLPHTRAAIERGTTQPDAMHSLMRVACEMSRVESLRIVLDHFDAIFETVGPESGAEAAALVAHPDLIPPLRRWLDRSPALVGHTLLLVGAIANVPIPEEESILAAIDDYWKASPEGPDKGQGPEGRWLM